MAPGSHAHAHARKHSAAQAAGLPGEFLPGLRHGLRARLALAPRRQTLSRLRSSAARTLKRQNVNCGPRHRRGRSTQEQPVSHGGRKGACHPLAPKRFAIVCPQAGESEDGRGQQPNKSTPAAPRGQRPKAPAGRPLPPRGQRGVDPDHRGARRSALPPSSRPPVSPADSRAGMGRDSDCYVQLTSSAQKPPLLLFALAPLKWRSAATTLSVSSQNPGRKCIHSALPHAAQWGQLQGAAALPPKIPVAHDPHVAHVARARRLSCAAWSTAATARRRASCRASAVGCVWCWLPNQPNEGKNGAKPRKTRRRHNAHYAFVWEPGPPCAAKRAPSPSRIYEPRPDAGGDVRGSAPGIEPPIAISPSRTVGRTVRPNFQLCVIYGGLSV